MATYWTVLAAYELTCVSRVAVQMVYRVTRGIISMKITQPIVHTHMHYPQVDSTVFEDWGGPVDTPLELSPPL